MDISVLADQYAGCLAQILSWFPSKLPVSLNPLSPSIHIQILQTDLHTFP